jgi:hypothetical protein
VDSDIPEIPTETIKNTELFEILSDGLVWDETQHKYVYEDETDIEDDWEPNPNIVANPCNCEHPSHFPDMSQYDPNQHGYLETPHDGRKALWVGEICNSCANGHYAGYLHETDKG